MMAISKEMILADGFGAVSALEDQKEEISGQIKATIEAVCVQTGISANAFKIARKFFDGSDGDRSDINTALHLAQRALNGGQPDLFDREDPVAAAHLREVAAHLRETGATMTLVTGKTN